MRNLELERQMKDGEILTPAAAADKRRELQAVLAMHEESKQTGDWYGKIGG